jgi:hypothetical protein
MGMSGSELFDPNRENKNKTNTKEVQKKAGYKTTKKNSCSYAACNTSL